jgi:rhodanese-related sulfurtransferase
MMSTLVRACLLVAVAALLGFVVNAARPHGVAVTTFRPPTQCSAADHAAGHADGPIELSPADAASLCGRADVVVADARSAAAFSEGHVADAVHLPCDAKGRVADDALARFSRAHTIVVYGQSTDDARPVAWSLSERHPGVRVAILTGGFAAWSAAGLACASGPCDDCKAQNP